MCPKPSCVPLISSHRNFSAWNFTPNCSHYFQLLSCIFLSTGFQPVTLKPLSFRKLNCFSCLVWVCDSMCYLLSAVQGFRLICFSIRSLLVIQSPLLAWGCSCMLISWFEQNTHRSLPKYLVFLIQREEVTWLGWVREADSGSAAVSCFFSALGDEVSFPETELWC